MCENVKVGHLEVSSVLDVAKRILLALEMLQVRLNMQESVIIDRQ